MYLPTEIEAVSRLVTKEEINHPDKFKITTIESGGGLIVDDESSAKDERESIK